MFAVSTHCLHQLSSSVGKVCGLIVLGSSPWLTSSAKMFSNLNNSSDKRQKHNPIIPPQKWKQFYVKAAKNLDKLMPYRKYFNIVSYTYIFPDKMRNRMANEVSTVASKTLEDNELMTQASLLSKEVLSKVLHDEDMKKQSAKFVTAILMTNETKEATSRLLISVLEEPEVILVISSKLKEILLHILQSDSTLETVLTQLSKIMGEKQTQNDVAKLIEDALGRPEVQDTFVQFINEVSKYKEIVTAGNNLGRVIATGVVSDVDVQTKTGTAIRAAIKSALTPSFLKRSAHKDEKPEK